MNGRIIGRASSHDEGNIGASTGQGPSGSFLGHFVDYLSSSMSSNHYEEEVIDNGTDSDFHALQRQRYLPFETS
jgi:hypothetical protein